MYVGRNNLLNRCLITWEHNVVRWVELILCLVCLLLSILMFYKRVFITTKIVHVAVHSAFVFILATDVISWCVKTPITIKTWMLISMTGFLMYCFTSGLLLFFTASSSTGLIIFSTVANIITAIVFLLDCLWVCWEYIHADYRTVIDADLRVIPGGTGPRIKSMTRSENLVDRAVSPYSLSEINEFECPVVRKRRGNLVYPAARPMRPMSYGGTFAVDKDLAPMSSGGSYKGISSVSGVSAPPSQQTRSRRSVRLVSVSSRTTGGDSRRSTTDPGQDYYYNTAPEGRSMLYPVDMGDADTVPEREYMDELSPEEELSVINGSRVPKVSYADQRGDAPDALYPYRSFTSSEPPAQIRQPTVSGFYRASRSTRRPTMRSSVEPSQRTTITTPRSVSPSSRGTSTNVRSASPSGRVTSTTNTTRTLVRSVSPSQREPAMMAPDRANGLDDDRSAYSQRSMRSSPRDEAVSQRSMSVRPLQDATSYRSQATGHSVDPSRSCTGSQRTAASRQPSQGRYIDSIAEEDIP